MRLNTRILTLALCALMSLTATSPARACAFHGYTPNPTFVDLLLATEHVVLAKLAQGNKREYAPVRTLLGPRVSEVPIGVSDMMHRELVTRPGAMALLARDGSYGPWVEIVALDTRYRELIEEIARKQPQWLLGRDADRVAFFAKRLNDPDPYIRELALREMDRAPYAILRRAQLPAVRGLRASLTEGDTDLKPVRILLAGLSRDDSFGALLHSKLDAAIVGDVAYIGAYVTALIELEGRGAVQALSSRYLVAGQDELTAEKVLQAFAIQYRAGPRGLRSQIVREVAKAVRAAPELGDIAARQFGFEGGWRPSK